MTASPPRPIYTHEAPQPDAPVGTAMLMAACFDWMQERGIWEKERTSEAVAAAIRALAPAPDQTTIPVLLTCHARHRAHWVELCAASSASK